MLTLQPGLRTGAVQVPPSKSHEHRLLIADFLAGNLTRLAPQTGDNADIQATKRCLKALAESTSTPVLDCGESGSTLRFLAPVAAALGKHPVYKKAGRLAERPMKEYPTLEAGVHELAGNISSQFVTGLLFALPLVKGDSEIRFTSPLESRGYVEMTLQVVRGAGIVVEDLPTGYRVPGGQTYRPQTELAVEGDWSGAAFWYAMNHLGNEIAISGLNPTSAQPDRIIADWMAHLPTSLDVSQCPDNFPALTIAAACTPQVTHITGTRRLRLKECDRVAAMADVLTRFGVKTTVGEGFFDVSGTSGPLNGGTFVTCNDHRIAMAIAVGATRAKAPVTLDNAACAAKSYPTFFETFASLAFKA